MALHPEKHLICVYFEAILIGVEWYQIMVLIHVSLVTSDGEHIIVGGFAETSVEVLSIF